MLSLVQKLLAVLFVSVFLLLALQVVLVDGWCQKGWWGPPHSTGSHCSSVYRPSSLAPPSPASSPSLGSPPSSGIADDDPTASFYPAHPHLNALPLSSRDGYQFHDDSNHFPPLPLPPSPRCPPRYVFAQTSYGRLNNQLLGLLAGFAFAAATNRTLIVSKLVDFPLHYNVRGHVPTGIARFTPSHWYSHGRPLPYNPEQVDPRRLFDFAAFAAAGHCFVFFRDALRVDSAARAAIAAADAAAAATTTTTTTTTARSGDPDALNASASAYSSRPPLPPPLFSQAFCVGPPGAKVDYSSCTRGRIEHSRGVAGHAMAAKVMATPAAAAAPLVHLTEAYWNQPPSVRMDGVGGVYGLLRPSAPMQAEICRFLRSVGMAELAAGGGSGRRGDGVVDARGARVGDGGGGGDDDDDDDGGGREATAVPAEAATAVSSLSACCAAYRDGSLSSIRRHCSAIPACSSVPLSSSLSPTPPSSPISAQSPARFDRSLPSSGGVALAVSASAAATATPPPLPLLPYVAVHSRNLEGKCMAYLRSVRLRMPMTDDAFADAAAACAPDADYVVRVTRRAVARSARHRSFDRLGEGDRNRSVHSGGRRRGTVAPHARRDPTVGVDGLRVILATSGENVASDADLRRRLGAVSYSPSPGSPWHPQGVVPGLVDFWLLVMARVFIANAGSTLSWNACAVRVASHVAAAAFVLGKGDHDDAVLTRGYDGDGFYCENINLTAPWYFNHRCC